MTARPSQCAIEQACGIELFRHRGQSVALTDFGQLVFVHSRRVFAQLDDLEGPLAAAGSLQIGRLELGADGPFAVLDLLAAFVARHPGVEVAMRLGNATRVLSDLRTDVALLNLTEPGADLHSQPVLRDRLVAIVPDSHAWASRDAIAMSEFEQELVLDQLLRTLEITGADLSAAVSLVCLAERRELRAVRAFFEVAESLTMRSDQAATC